MDGADGVYPASEDTYLLIDALTQDADFLQEHFADGLCIEIGYVMGVAVNIREALVKPTHYALWRHNQIAEFSI